MRCEHEHDDGAYILGALAPAERTAYERHLSTCSFCRKAVADLAVLPGLLGRIDPADLERLLEPPVGHPIRAAHDRMPDLVAAAQQARRHQRSRTRRWTAGVGLAATCLALVAGAGAVTTWQDQPSPAEQPRPESSASQLAPATMAMQPVSGPVPLTANVSLVSTSWGTKVGLVCTYADGAAKATAESPKSYTFRLMAYGPDDDREQIGSWIAQPGTEVNMSGMTRFIGKGLSRLELVRNDGTKVLAYNIP